MNFKWVVSDLYDAGSYMDEPIFNWSISHTHIDTTRDTVTTYCGNMYACVIDQLNYIGSCICTYACQYNVRTKPVAIHLYFLHTSCTRVAHVPRHHISGHDWSWSGVFSYSVYTRHSILNILAILYIEPATYHWDSRRTSHIPIMIPTAPLPDMWRSIQLTTHLQFICNFANEL